MRLSALNRKLFRDLLGMRGQALAIAVVIGAGVSMFVMYLSNFASLERTRTTYYDRQRFADVFASLERAPERLAERIARIPGVAQVETRVVADVILDVPGLDDPSTGRLISVPTFGRPVLNQPYLRAGDWVDPARPDGVLASEAFCLANRLRVGDRLSAVINGRQRRLTIVGIVLSPEYVYTMRPGEVVPDPRRFGILWMERRALAAAFDMEGAFNDVALTLGPGVSADAVIAELDRLLRRYGARGAIPRFLQMSNWMLENELRQLRQFGFIVPLIFLMVAAFILNVALTRALALQRTQIAALKALGYDNRQLAWHYLKWALLIAVLGVVAGIAAGAWLGAAMIRLYNDYFRFPILLYQLSSEVVLAAAALSLAAAAAGAFVTVRRAVRVPPAEAMRPEPPAEYRPSLAETVPAGRRLPHAARMVFRNIERQPFRALMSVTGIAMAGAILLVGFVFVDAMDQLMALQFTVADRSHVTLNFVRPRSADALYALRGLPGVLTIEPTRVVAARLRSGHRARNLAITGLPPRPELRRVVDREGRAQSLPPSGLVLSSTLARILDVEPGDTVIVEVMEGTQPVKRIPVSGLVDDILGLSAYMTLDALHGLMREPRVLSGASLLIDPAREAELASRLKRMPVVAGVGFKANVLQNFRELMAESMWIMIVMNVFFAGVIAFGVVYNAARVSLSERSRELASLRVLGFTRAEISMILLGELAVLTLVALPLGAILGAGLSAAIVAGFESEVYRFPLDVTASAVAKSALVVIAASLISGLVVRRRLDGLDLVGVLKIRE